MRGRPLNARENLPAPPPLLWNDDGAVRCTRHAPHPFSDTWEREAWRRMSDAQIAAFATKTGMPTTCECCRLAAARAAEARR